MPEPQACPDCLRRAWLIASLSGHIGVAVSDAKGRRAHELLALPDERLAREMARSDAPRLLAEAKTRPVAELRRAVAAARAWATCPHDGGYPAGVGDLGDAPHALFGRGDHAHLEALCPPDAVTIVGARRPSAYGREMAERLARESASSGLVVISGMALGIDSRAHAGALEAGGLTVAVLGSGVDVVYPARARNLYSQIAERGLILSELPPGTTARRWTFPARNRIMAALAAMTVVVEARSRSGSLITAEMAQELGREVGAVPGRVGATTAAGANDLLRDGAHVIRDAGDVLDSMVGAGAAPATHRRAISARGPALGADEREVLEIVETGADTADDIARRTRLETGVLATALVRLELGGYLRSLGGGRYERSSLAQG